MIRTQISLDPDLYRRARREAKRRGISFAEFVRRALAHVLTTRPTDRPWMSLAGSIEDGGPDASRSVDAVVYGRPRP
ncbi:MAG: ribbon-helix-helix protein, CopG family [Gemmatimonadota bacterium]